MTYIYFLTLKKVFKNIINFDTKIVDFSETTYYPEVVFRKIRRLLLVPSFSNINIYYLESRNNYEH